MNSSKLSDGRSDSLKKILDDHHDLAVCYAMKEAMCDLFDLTDPGKAEDGWKNWFQAAMRGAEYHSSKSLPRLKKKRIDGLVAHSAHPISTGKLEGFNNKIKVAKRIGYGYRNDEYFFTLVRYSSLPAVRQKKQNEG